MIGHRDIQIEVDGGVNDVIAGQVAKAGADLMVGWIHSATIQQSTKNCAKQLSS